MRSLLLAVPLLVACVAGGDDDTGDVNDDPSIETDCPGSAVDGEPCDDPGAPSCSFEGTGSCDTPPAGGICACDADGTWHCFCGCYGPAAVCPITTYGTGCPWIYHPELDGARCDPALPTCSYDQAACTCVDDGAGGGMFDCT